MTTNTVGPDLLQFCRTPLEYALAREIERLRGEVSRLQWAVDFRNTNGFSRAILTAEPTDVHTRMGPTLGLTVAAYVGGEIHDYGVRVVGRAVDGLSVMYAVDRYALAQDAKSFPDILAELHRKFTAELTDKVGTALFSAKGE